MPDSPGEIFEVAAQFRSALLRRERQASSRLVRAYGQAWQRIKRELDQLQAEIETARATGEIVDQAWLRERYRLRQLLAQVETQIGQFARYAEASILSEQQAAVAAAQEHAEALTKAAAAGRVSYTWNRVPTEAVEDLVGFLSNGSPLKALLDELGPSASDGVAAALTTGLALGHNPRKIAGEVAQSVGLGLTRALRISRTEVMRSYREATRRNYQANDDVVKGWIWHAHVSGPGSERTCAMCVTGDTVVSGPAVQKVFTRHYTGDVVVIETASGKQLTVTPNHPILTPRGWIRANLLQEGDDVVSSADSDGAALGVGIHNYHVPTLIAKIAESFGVISAEMECTPPDFHGDGIGSQVYVVRADSLLRNNLDSLGDQHVAKQNLTLRGSGSFTLRRFFFPRPGGTYSFFQRLPIRFGMIVKGLPSFVQGNFTTAQDAAFGDGASRGASDVQANGNRVSVYAKGFSQAKFSFSSNITGGDFIIWQLQESMKPTAILATCKRVALLFGAQKATIPEYGSQTLPTDAELRRNLLGCLSGKIGLDRVLKVDVRSFSGHVYNLQTEKGWYSANGIITHNCWAMHGSKHKLDERLDDHVCGRCAMIPDVPTWEELGVSGFAGADVTIASGPTLFAALSDAEQNRILGNAAGAAYRGGAVKLEDFVGQRQSRLWGSMRYARSLREVLGEQEAARWKQEAAPVTE